MNTIQEIAEILPLLSTDELQQIEQVIHDLYRNREVNFIYDDDYGIWTEQDQNFTAAISFRLLDEEEGLEENGNS